MVKVGAYPKERPTFVLGMSTESPPGFEEAIPPTKIYNPLSFPVLALLIPASVLGVLARLGLVALMSYDGHVVFPLAYPQAVGCLVMGFAFGLKEPIGQMYVLALFFLPQSHSCVNQLCSPLYGSHDWCDLHTFFHPSCLPPCRILWIFDYFFNLATTDIRCLDKCPTSSTRSLCQR